MTQKLYSISAFAKQVGVGAWTLRNYDKKGILKPSHITPSGHRRYTEDQIQTFKNQHKHHQVKPNIGYVRVSSRKQLEDLECQYQLMESFLSAKGEPYEIIKSVGSGIDYSNPALQQLIDKVINKETNHVYVLHKDRLLRFGFDLVAYLFEKFNTSITVVNQSTTTPDEDLTTDLTQIITVFSARLNGRRKYKLKELEQVLQDEEN